MKNNSIRLVFLLAAIIAPGIAFAQQIPPVIAALVLSPLLVMVLVVVLGVVVRSWKVGAAHAGLIVVWLALLGIASYWVENDYVIWTPLALYVIHAVIIVVLIAVNLIRRARSRGS